VLGRDSIRDKLERDNSSLSCVQRGLPAGV
jgi:hypothetical protein